MDDAKTIEALKRATRATQVHRQAGDAAEGFAMTMDGQTYVFADEAGVTRRVPRTDVDAQPAPSPAPNPTP